MVAKASETERAMVHYAQAELEGRVPHGTAAALTGGRVPMSCGQAIALMVLSVNPTQYVTGQLPSKLRRLLPAGRTIEQWIHQTEVLVAKGELMDLLGLVEFGADTGSKSFYYETLERINRLFKWDADFEHELAKLLNQYVVGVFGDGATYGSALEVRRSTRFHLETLISQSVSRRESQAAARKAALAEAERMRVESAAKEKAALDQQARELNDVVALATGGIVSGSW